MTDLGPEADNPISGLILDQLRSQGGKLDLNASNLDKFVAKTEIWQDSATVHMTNVDMALNGNGKPGIKLEVDRLKQTEKSREKIIWLALGAAIAGIATQVASHFGSQ